MSNLMQSSRQGRCSRRSSVSELALSPSMLEALESRTLLSGAFVGVGLAVSEDVPAGYDAWAYQIEGSIESSNGALSGQIEALGRDNPIASSTLSGRQAVDLGYGRPPVILRVKPASPHSCRTEATQWDSRLMSTRTAI